MAQIINGWSGEGGIAKLACNGLSYNAAGEWLLPYWRELGGGPACQKVPKLHGVAGVMITGDQVQRHIPLTLLSRRSGTLQAFSF